MPRYRCRSQYLIPVPEVLSDSPSLQEILWNFCRFKDEKQRLTLRDNPHFYTKLPTLPEEYGDTLKIDPTEDFRHANKFYVLTDKPELVHIVTDRFSRSYGNIWCPQNAIIFKGLGHFLLRFSPMILVSARYLWDAQGRNHRQGITRRHKLYVL